MTTQRDDALHLNEAVQPEERPPEPGDGARLRQLFELMLLIRAFEPEAERQYKAAKIGGYCHLATGQEAAHVGAVGALHDDDVLVTAYRDHGLALARGIDRPSWPSSSGASTAVRRGGMGHVRRHRRDRREDPERLLRLPRRAGGARRRR